MNKPTTAYLLIEEDNTNMITRTLAAFYDLEEAEAFKADHNAHADAYVKWRVDSYNFADSQPEIAKMLKRNSELLEILRTQDKKDLKRTQMQDERKKLSAQISKLQTPLIDKWRKENPFKCNAPHRNGYCIIETIKIQ